MVNSDGPVNDKDNSQVKEKEAKQEAQKAKENERFNQMQRVQDNAKSGANKEKDSLSLTGSNDKKGEGKNQFEKAEKEKNTEKREKGIEEKGQKRKADQSNLKNNDIGDKPDITAKKDKQIDNAQIQNDKTKINKELANTSFYANADKPDITKKNDKNDIGKGNTEAEYQKMAATYANADKPDITKQSDIIDRSKENAEADYYKMIANKDQTKFNYEIPTIERNSNLSDLPQNVLEDSIHANQRQLEYYSNTADKIPPGTIGRLLNNEEILKEEWINRKTQIIENESKINDKNMISTETDNKKLTKTSLSASADKPDITKKNDGNDLATGDAEAEYYKMVANNNQTNFNYEIPTVERNSNLTDLPQIVLEDSIHANQRQLEYYSNTADKIPPGTIDRLLNNEEILKEEWINRKNHILENESKIEDKNFIWTQTDYKETDQQKSDTPQDIGDQEVRFWTLSDRAEANPDFEVSHIPAVAVSTSQAFLERTLDQGGSSQNNFGASISIVFGGYNLLEGIFREDGGQIIGGGLGLVSGITSRSSNLLKPGLVTIWEHGKYGIIEDGAWMGSASGAARAAGASTALTWVGISFEMYRLGLAQPLMDAVNEEIRKSRMSNFSLGFAASLFGYNWSELKNEVSYLEGPGPSGKGHPQIVEREARKVAIKGLHGGFTYGYSLSDGNRQQTADEIVNSMNNDDKYFLSAAISDFSKIQVYARVIYRLGLENY